MPTEYWIGGRLLEKPSSTVYIQSPVEDLGENVSAMSITRRALYPRNDFFLLLFKFFTYLLCMLVCVWHAHMCSVYVYSHVWGHMCTQPWGGSEADLECLPELLST